MKYYPILKMLLESFHLIFISTFTNFPFWLNVFIPIFIKVILCMLISLELFHLCYDLIHPSIPLLLLRNVLEFLVYLKHFRFLFLHLLFLNRKPFKCVQIHAFYVQKTLHIQNILDVHM